MAIDYNKYILSKATHYISNSGSDERGKYNSGKAGDQTGKEWQLRNWYNRPWTVVLRHPDPEVRRLIAELGIEAALNSNVGYDQYQRTTYWKQLQAVGYRPSAITTPCEEDCTAGVTANVKAVGYLLGVRPLQDISIDTYSGNMKSRFQKAGFLCLTDKKHIAGTGYLLPGDILLYEGHHAATNISAGKMAEQTGEGLVLQGSPKPQPSHDWRLGDRILKHGCQGEDVKDLQSMLIEAGYSCGSYGIDGDFGDSTELAVKTFQRAHPPLEVDGEAGPLTIAALKEALATPTAPEKVRIVGGNCYIRDRASAIDGAVLGVALNGDTLPWVATMPNGWQQVKYGNAPQAYVSGKYGKLV